VEEGPVVASADPRVMRRADELMRGFADGPTPDDLDRLAASASAHVDDRDQGAAFERELAAELRRRAEQMRAVAKNLW
jgi:hypothetical protein